MKEEGAKKNKNKNKKQFDDYLCLKGAKEMR